MKRITLVSVILVIVLILATGCESTSTPTSPKVNLCNLKECVLDDTVFELSEKELESVMSAKFSAIDIDISAEEIEDKDVSVFNCKTVTEYKSEIIKEIVSHRLTEEYYNFLLEHSYVEYNKSAEQFVAEVISNCRKIAEQQNTTFDIFLNNTFQMDEHDFNVYISNIWTDMQIVFAYCETYDISTPSETELKNAESQLFDSQEMKYFLASTSIANDFIKFSVLSSKLYNHIENAFSDQIVMYSTRLAAELT